MDTSKLRLVFIRDYHAYVSALVILFAYISFKAGKRAQK